jgi:hypothetical protein
LTFWTDPVLSLRREVSRTFVGDNFEDIRTRTPDIHFVVEEIVAVNEDVIERGVIQVLT